MKRTVTAAAALVGAVALAGATFAAPASAAPNRLGATEIAPNAVLASILVSVDKPFTDRDGDGAPEFGIVGNPASGVINHVGGITITDLAGTTEYELRNYAIDTTGEEITVSAVVNGGDALTLFTATDDDGNGVFELRLNDLSSTVLAGDTSASGLQVADVSGEFWNF
jgi:hypothetical protein